MINKIKLYLDMDGVLADFMRTYKTIEGEDSPDKFKLAVLEYRIFKDLKPMSDAKMLLHYVKGLKDIQIEVLTSVGTNNKFLANKVKSQKSTWLRKHGIEYPINFVHNKPQKAYFADNRSILIDDSPGCVNPFNAAGGYGILHTTASNSIRRLNSIIEKITNGKQAI